MAVSIVVNFNKFPQLAGGFDQNVSDALDLAVLTCTETADPLTPRDTGELVRNKTIERGADFREITWNQEYAAYNEFGTIRMSPRPFARPGAEAAEPVFINALKAFGE